MMIVMLMMMMVVAYNDGDDCDSEIINADDDYNDTVDSGDDDGDHDKNGRSFCDVGECGWCNEYAAQVNEDSNTKKNIETQKKGIFMQMTVTVAASNLHNRA